MFGIRIVNLDGATPPPFYVSAECWLMWPAQSHVADPGWPRPEEAKSEIRNREQAASAFLSGSLPHSTCEIY